MVYSYAADLIVVLHLIFAGFVVFGFFSLLIGPFFGWAWTSGKRFRITHMTCIIFVALEGLLGVVCPLTILENQFLQAAGKSGYHRSFIGRLANQFLFYDAPEWAFSLTYVTMAIFSILAYLIPFSICKTLLNRKDS